jgi:Flp pilus assembly protein TadG
MIRVNRTMRRDEGQSLVEFALVVPVLLLLVLGIFQFAPVWNENLSLNAAARAAARTAETCRFATSSSAAATAITSSYTAITNPAGMGSSAVLVNGVTPSSWASAGGCVSGTEVTVTGTYPASVTILGVTFVNTTLTSTSVSTVE